MCSCVCTLFMFSPAVKLRHHHSNRADVRAQHDVTRGFGDVTVLCTGSAGSDASLNLYSLKMSRVLNTHPNATPTTLLNIRHHNLSPHVRRSGDN
ncbi:hypothetical protein V1264_017593 [Littorina saxatilis]|uniref:Uncharacterized protein n=1 Tax=Littorina saxatilis TaxID=31220 RepID=A0AAN9BIU2_9CAEN